MLNPGVKTLAALGISGALAEEAQTAIGDLDGMSAVTLEAEMRYGSGGTSIAAVVQTSLDGGTIWLDIARFDFTTATAIKWCVLQGSAAKAIASHAALASEGVNDGLLGDRLRAVISSVGTYAGTTVAVRAAVR